MQTLRYRASRAGAGGRPRNAQPSEVVRLPHDIAVINRARKPKSGDVVVAYVNKEPNLKTYLVQDADTVILHAENPAFPDQVITPDTDFEVFGVLRNIVKRF